MVVAPRQGTNVLVAMLTIQSLVVAYEKNEVLHSVDLDLASGPDRPQRFGQDQPDPRYQQCRQNKTGQHSNR